MRSRTLIALSAVAPVLMGGWAISPAEAAATCHGRPVTVKIAKGQLPTEGEDVILGTTGNDNFQALGGNDWICAGGGDDVIQGGPGADRIWGEDGDDWLDGGKGADVLKGGAGADALFGLEGNDKLMPGLGDDGFQGGPGIDTLSYADAPDRIHFNLSELNYGQDTIGSGSDTATDEIENLTATKYADVLTGTNGKNVLKGGAGDDQFYPLYGGDSIVGGPGFDWYLFGGLEYGVVLDLSLTTEQMSGVGPKTLVDRLEKVSGTSHDDTLLGSSYADVLDGGGGADLLKGRGGNDTLYGGDGHDRLEGGNGSDDCHDGEELVGCEL